METKIDPHSRFRRRVNERALVADDGTVKLSHESFGVAGGCLSTEETAALGMMADGLRNDEIAAALSMTVKAFYKVRQRLFGKLGARTQEHAAAIAFRRGILQGDRRQSGAVVNRLQDRLGSQRGQVIAFVAVGLVAICGLAGFVIDVSSWYQAQSKQQAIADAAATAGVAWLPSSPGQATSDAQAYATKNGGSSGDTTVAYSTKYLPNDTMTVTTHTTAPTYFLKVLGRGSVSVTATAVARAEAVTSVYGAMPFTVSKTQPELSGSGCPCFGQPTTLQLGKSGSGGFAILDIDGSQGNVQNSTLASWIVNGCTCDTTAPVWIYINPGNSYSSGAVQTAMNSVIGKTMLFPVYDTIRGTGSNAQYHIIAFSAFQISSYNFSGNNGTITGSFVKATWRGAGSGGSGQYFGVTTDQLVG